MKWIVWTFGFALVAALGLLALLAWGQKRRAIRICRDWSRLTGNEPILFEPSARFLGLATGAGSPRGGGVLVLGEREIYFERFHPAAVWRLDLDRLLKLEAAQEFGGRRRPGHGFLVLVYHDERGRAERAGFRVVDTDRWILEAGRNARLCKGLPAEGGCT